MTKKYLIQSLRYWPIFAVLLGMYLLDSGWAAILLYHAGIVAGLWIRKIPISHAFQGFRAFPAVGLWITGVATAPVVVYLMPLLLGMSPDEVKTALQAGLERAGVSGVCFWIFVIYLCLPHPILEELGWRELQFVSTPRPHLRDLQFASYHLLVMHYFFPANWPFFVACLVALTAMGWIWRQMKTKYQGLAVPIWFHSGGDLGVMLGIWWLLR